VASRMHVGGRTQIVSFHIPKNILRALDRLVEMGVFNNRSEAIRLALYKLIEEYRDFLLEETRGPIPRPVLGFR